MSRWQLQVSAHALQRLSQRFGADVSVGWLRVSLPKAQKLFSSPSGTYFLLRVGERLAVPVVRGRGDKRVLTTVVTVPQAFSDCPRAVFLALLEVGELLLALQLRAKSLDKRLPAPIGEGAYGTSYPAQRAHAVWNAFREVRLRPRQR